MSAAAIPMPVCLALQMGYIVSAGGEREPSVCTFVSAVKCICLSERQLCEKLLQLERIYTCTHAEKTADCWKRCFRTVAEK